jgi:hypothetical protein
VTVRAPLLLLLAAAAPAAAGLWEEIGRNTDVTLAAAAASDLVERGRAPDLGPVAGLQAEARLSVPATALNLVLAAAADRSLDGTPRLDRRAASLSVEWFGESVRARLGATHEINLGVNPASLGELADETAFHVGLSEIPLGENWMLDLLAAGVPRREERRGEVAVQRLLFWQPDKDSPSVTLSLRAGDLRALDADADGRGRVEGWSYAGADLTLFLRLGPGNLRLSLGTQQATDTPGDRDGWVELGYSRAF